eukprot:5820870-Amphidinium_carterae.1
MLLLVRLLHCSASTQDTCIVAWSGVAASLGGDDTLRACDIFCTVAGRARDVPLCCCDGESQGVTCSKSCSDNR